MIGIYSITNIINRKRYIGQSINIEKRWSDHKCALRNNRHPNTYLQNAWNKYGESSFCFEVLTECSIDELDNNEIKYIQIYKATDRGYGYCYESGGSTNKIVSDETRVKISDALKGHPVSEEFREKMRIISTGKHLSEEAKRKVSEASKGRKMSEETKQKLSSLRKGVPLSEETKRKLSESHKGHKWTQEQLDKVVGKYRGENSPNYGKHLSDETRKKLSESLKGRAAWNKGIPASEEQKRKQSEKMKGRPSNRARKIIDLTTGIIYSSVKEAKEKTGFSHIDTAARGERNHAGGHQWKYIESCATAQ